MPLRDFLVLITDFGLTDTYVGVMKGVVSSVVPEAKIIDLTHSVAPQNIQEAARILVDQYEYFPKGALFMVVVDPGVGSERKIILLQKGDYYFLAPDNGVLEPLTQETENIKIWDIDLSPFKSKVSYTFHGRDIFSPLAAKLLEGIPPEEMGKVIKKIQPLTPPFKKPFKKGRQIWGEIIHEDHFGNLITNLKKKDLPKRFQWKLGEKLVHGPCQTYSSVGEGEVLLLFGSDNRLEIALNGGHAGKALSFKVGDSLCIEALS